MTKPRDLEAELRSLQHDLMCVFQRTFPSKQFQAELILGVVSLGLTLKQMSRSRDLGERRKLKAEFDHGLSVLRQGISILWESRWGKQIRKPAATARGGGLFCETASSASHLE